MRRLASLSPTSLALALVTLAAACGGEAVVDNVASGGTCSIGEW